MTKSEINKTAAGENRGDKVFAYLFFGGTADDCENTDLSGFPEERTAEILSSKSEKVRRQKIAVWKLLLFAAKKTYGLSAEEITKLQSEA